MLRCHITLDGNDWWALSKKVLITTLIGAGFALILEADHSAELPLLVAFILWSTHILFAAALFLLMLWSLERQDLRAPYPGLIAIIILPALFAPISLLLDLGLGNIDEELERSASLLTVYASEVWAVAPITFAIALVMSFILHQQKPAENEGGSELQPISLRHLIDTVPSSLGDDIIRVHAQDHYVKIVTAEGEALLSEQFGDCVDKLIVLDGLQCHRSHWINLAHVVSFKRTGSSYICTLSNGDEVPVSRRRYADMKGRIGLENQHISKSDHVI